MKNINVCFLVSFLSLALFSNYSFGFESLSLTQEPSNTASQNTERKLSINSVFDKYNPLRLFSIDQNFKNNFEVKHSISFDKKNGHDPVNFDLTDSSLDEKKIQLNITVWF